MEKEEFYNFLNNPHLLNENSLNALMKLTEQHPGFQAARFLFLKNLKNIKSPNFNSELKKSAPLIADRKQLSSFLNAEKYQKPETINFDHITEGHILYFSENDENTTSTNNLIDKFLSSKQGTLKLEKKSGIESGEFIENQILNVSNAENDELITETLADIYLKQKKYEKAIEAFQKLSLKYPEKSAYFATRIEETEKLKTFN